MTSSVSANSGEALCGSPFPQVATNRTCRSYAFSWRLVFSPSRSDDIRGRIRGSDDAGARLGTGSMLGRSLVGGGPGMQRRGSRHQICHCLGDSCQSSVPSGPVGSGQVRLGGVSVQCGLVRSSKAWWNDRQNDHEASGEGALRPARMRARPEGQSGLPDRRTGETWFARGPSGRAASPGVKVPTRASVRVTSGAYRSDLHLCRSTRTVRDEDKAL